MYNNMMAKDPRVESVKIMLSQMRAMSESEIVIMKKFGFFRLHDDEDDDVLTRWGDNIDSMFPLIRNAYIAYLKKKKDERDKDILERRAMGEDVYEDETDLELTTSWEAQAKAEMLRLKSIEDAKTAIFNAMLDLISKIAVDAGKAPGEIMRNIEEEVKREHAPRA